LAAVPVQIEMEGITASFDLDVDVSVGTYLLGGQHSTPDRRSVAAKRCWNLKQPSVNLLRQFDTRDYASCVVESLETKHWL